MEILIKGNGYGLQLDGVEAKFIWSSDTSRLSEYCELRRCLATCAVQADICAECLNLRRQQMKRTTKITMSCIALGAVIACGAYLGYLARLTYNGYCHAERKYLTDEEKIRVAVADVIRKYPPPIMQIPVSYGWSLDIPENPIYYRDVDDFLEQNPNCCFISRMSLNKGMDNTEPRFIERATGGVSAFVSMNYAVRYLDVSKTTKSVDVTGYLALSNCGIPVRWWNPLDSDFYFVYQLLH